MNFQGVEDALTRLMKSGVYSFLIDYDPNMGSASCWSVGWVCRDKYGASSTGEVFSCDPITAINLALESIKEGT